MSNAGRCFPTAETHPTFQLRFVHSTLYIFPMIPFNLKDAGKQIHMCVRILWIYIKILKCFLTRWSAGVLFSPCNINIFLKCFPRELHCFYNRKIFEQMLFHFKLCWKWNQFFKMCFMGAVFPNLPEGEQGIKSASLKLRPQSGCAGVAGIFSSYLYVHLCLSYQSIMFLNSPSSQGIVGWQTILDPLSKTMTSGWLMHRGTELSLREGPTDGNLGILFYVVLSVTGNGRNLHCWVCYSSYILREGQASCQSCPVVSTACSGSAWLDIYWPTLDCTDIVTDCWLQGMMVLMFRLVRNIVALWFNMDQASH